MLKFWHDISFANPGFLWLLLLLPPLAWYLWYFRNKYRASVRFYSMTQFNTSIHGLKWFLAIFNPYLRILALAFFIVAMARPQTSSSWQDISSEGIDIVISLDISTSMLAEDLKPNRLEASKDVAIDFIDERPNDRIGLVVFSGESFTQCPLTTDHDVLKNLFKDLKCGMLKDGTAVGLGLATAINRLKESQAKSKVIILLTDGSNNAGEMAPLTAADIARKFGIRVYTIGVGTKGLAPYPFKDPLSGRTVYQNVEVRIDEKTMQDISSASGGKYFRATSTSKLKKIYKEIDQLEKTKFEVNEFKNKQEAFFPFALIGFTFVLLELLIKYVWINSVNV